MSRYLVCHVRTGTLHIIQNGSILCGLLPVFLSDWKAVGERWQEHQQAGLCKICKAAAERSRDLRSEAEEGTR